MRDLFPEIQPFKSERFRVSDIHELYLEQCGNPNGAPVLFLHGGPGAGISEKSRRYFDPAHYRIILFDQRGAGRSTPPASIEQNTTWDLIDDIERIRTHLGIEQWILFGGSWGSTLALTYAVKFPKRTRGLIMRGIFLGSQSELDWCCKFGWNQIFPECWERFVSELAPSEKSDLVGSYYKKLTSPDRAVRHAAALAWVEWESGVLKLIPDESLTLKGSADPEFAMTLARIECHYFVNKLFFESDNYILSQIAKIQDIPGVIVHGRYDMVCPYRVAWQLHNAWPSSKLVTVPDAGHASDEAGIRSALVEATEEFKRRI